MIRTQEDSFSGRKIYPGKGKIFVRGDRKAPRGNVDPQANP
jgi:ribosomal protein L24E